MSAFDEQVGGDHYRKLAIQPMEFCQRNKLGFIESTAIKYIIRHPDKGGREDVEKAIHCLQMLLDIEYSIAPPIEPCGSTPSEYVARTDRPRDLAPGQYVMRVDRLREMVVGDRAEVARVEYVRDDGWVLLEPPGLDDSSSYPSGHLVEVPSHLILMANRLTATMARDE